MKKFKKYVKSFDFNETGIKYKYYHSFRVMRISKYLSKALKLNKEDKDLAIFIGLYHDIGRFNQLKEFNTMKDNKSFDHGDEGYDVLDNGNFLVDFDKEERKIILDSVKYHNKYKINPFLNKREMMHAKLIRDADKLDIIKMLSKGKIFDFDRLNKDVFVTESIDKEFMKCKQLKLDKAITSGDLLLRLLAFVFDINYEESFKYLYRKNYINKIYNKVENKEYYKKYFDIVNEYIRKKVEIC